MPTGGFLSVLNGAFFTAVDVDEKAFLTGGFVACTAAAVVGLFVSPAPVFAKADAGAVFGRGVFLTTEVTFLVEAGFLADVGVVFEGLLASEKEEEAIEERTVEDDESLPIEEDANKEIGNGVDHPEEKQMYH